MSSAADPAADAEREAALAALRALHAEIDREAARLAGRHAARLRCGRGCAGCCVDDLTVAPVEAERIRRAHPELLATGTPHAPGACAFLDEQGACRVYADRPAVCRSQGLPLRFFYEDEAGEVVERRDICPLNVPGGPPLDQLEEDDCWLIGPHELRLGALAGRFRGADAMARGSDADRSVVDDAAAADAADAERVALRSLFARSRTDAS